GFVFEQTAYDASTAPDGLHLYVAGSAIPGTLASDPSAVAGIADTLERDVAAMVPGLGDAVWRRRQLVFDPSIGVMSTP
ncbi:MAG: hypothetical protein GWN79_10765, partial [Actinobacteria bacterium]|nr:hypothetical protein [Actinomycetota bacterium]NIS31735.1 hypothetical protein [Actinomycetota bacterium]NIU19533.1 hypothetical protein [Actinomycetota bacterium]NIU66831.1 hypothetical protein [Actinomycetota bacterium]NIW28632.1 hypothetical protein [Actinomycetota bacterium]